MLLRRRRTRPVDGHGARRRRQTGASWGLNYSSMERAVEAIVMAVERVGDYRAVMPMNRSRRERDERKRRPNRGEPANPPPKEHQIDERA